MLQKAQKLNFEKDGSISKTDRHDCYSFAKDFHLEDRVEEIKNQAKYYAEKSFEIENERELSPEIKFICQQFYLPVDNNVLLLLAMRGTMSFKAFPSNASSLGVAMKTEITYMTIGGQKILLLPGQNFVSTVYGGFMDKENSTTGLSPEVNAEPLADFVDIFFLGEGE